MFRDLKPKMAADEAAGWIASPLSYFEEAGI